jgi:methylated-DNA-[protein]-cysteine S-methyltransferase
MIIHVDHLETPLGTLSLAVREHALVALGFNERWQDLTRKVDARFGQVVWCPEQDPAGVSSRLRRYFQGELEVLAGIAADPGGTQFQRRVWSALRDLPVGCVVSYAELAARIGASGAVRAVAGANAANPIAVVIPCHRVIGSDGRLHGYAYGLERKQWLLDHESASGWRQRELIDLERHTPTVKSF